MAGYGRHGSQWVNVLLYLLILVMLVNLWHSDAVEKNVQTQLMIVEWFLDPTEFSQLSFCAHAVIMNYVTKLFPLEFLSQEKTTV